MDQALGDAYLTERMTTDCCATTYYVVHAYWAIELIHAFKRLIQTYNIVLNNLLLNMLSFRLIRVGFLLTVFEGAQVVRAFFQELFCFKAGLRGVEWLRLLQASL